MGNVDMLDLTEWCSNVMQKLYAIEDAWFRSNLKRFEISFESTKGRCRVEKWDQSHMWITTLYIDERVVSVLRVNSITMEATVSNQS